METELNLIVTQYTVHVRCIDLEILLRWMSYGQTMVMSPPNFLSNC